MEGAKRLIGEAVTLLESPVEVARDADAVVLVTEWHHYQEMDWAALRDVMRTPHLIDGRHFLDPERMTALGFQYQTIG
jgi:UDPglucose 6-dehydrogenase